MDLLNQLTEHLDKSFEKPDDSVFHHTEFCCLQKIVESKYLELHAHSYLNEKGNNEGITGIEIINNLLDRYSDFYREKEIFSKFITDKVVTFYTVSFCNEKMSSYVLKEYGNYYLELESDFLQAFANINRPSLLFGSVDYEKNSQEKIISGMLEIYQQFEFSKDNICILLTNLCIAIPLFKNNSYSREKECRVIGTQKCLDRLSLNKDKTKIYKGTKMIDWHNIDLL